MKMKLPALLSAVALSVTMLVGGAAPAAAAPAATFTVAVIGSSSAGFGLCHIDVAISWSHAGQGPQKVNVLDVNETGPLVNENYLFASSGDMKAGKSGHTTFSGFDAWANSSGTVDVYFKYVDRADNTTGLGEGVGGFSLNSACALPT